MDSRLISENGMAGSREGRHSKLRLAPTVSASAADAARHWLIIAAVAGSFLESRPSANDPIVAVWDHV